MHKNKVALITGGSEGIGYGIAEVFIEAGLKVAITGRDENKLKKAKESLGSEIIIIKADISEVESATLTVDSVVNEYGQKGSSTNV
jgi:NADP-dependent 3-hydroxy acid dehydrogenase YdfG